jgi:hypothetical protein
MSDDLDEIQWTPRLAKEKLRRLYESEAAGRIDEELLEDVGITLLLRCEDILAIDRATHGSVPCDRCRRAGLPSAIPRRGHSKDEVLCCPQCGWRIVWGDYLRSIKRKQLHLGGAGASFRQFVADYPVARTPRDKMLAVDRLIHGFHCSLKDQPDLPTRACGVNLISGRLTDVVQFLNELAGVANADPAHAQTYARWRDQCLAAGTWHPH